MRRLSVRRSDRSSSWLPVAAGAAIGIAAGIAARLVLGGLDRDILQASPTRVERLVVRPGVPTTITIARTQP